MLKRLALLIVLLIPTAVLALEIQPGSPYIDVRASSPEAPAINLLTRLGVIQGIGNQRFGRSRLVNRAEFLKIAMQLYIQKREDGSGGYSWYKNHRVTETGCFPDVPLSAWFGPYVCEAYDAGFVRGYTDGLFHPERTVQYDEALKILTLIYGYEIPTNSGEDWVTPYYESAAQRGVDLPLRIQFGTLLPRAYAARLIAAFEAESEGQLQNLRFAEAGRYDLIITVASSSSSSQSSSTQSVSSSSSSVASSSSSLPPAPLFTLPPSSHFLRVGMASDAVADIVIPAEPEAQAVGIVEVRLFTEVRSLQNLELVTEDGIVLATLLRHVTDNVPNYKLLFEAQIAPENQKILAANTAHHLVLRATVKPADSGGFSDEFFQVNTFRVTVRGLESNVTKTIPGPGGFPQHQTSLSRITEVKRVSPATAVLRSGSGLLLSAFTVKAAPIPGKSTSLDGVIFSYRTTGIFRIGPWILASGTQSVPCTNNEATSEISCDGLAQAFGLLGTDGITIELRANVSVTPGATDASFHADLLSPGSPEALGSLHWTDGVSHFRWVEGPTPLALGTHLQ